MTSQFDAIQQALEAACAQFQLAPTKETTEALVKFRSLPDIIPVAKYILERSSSTLAQFESITALREAVTSRWDTLTPHQIVDVRDYLLAFITARSYLPYHIHSHTAHAIAVIGKRGWLNLADLSDSPTTQEMKVSLMNTIGQLLRSGDITKVNIGIMLAVALIEEMQSSSKATALNLPWEYHMKCFQEFEIKQLKDLFALAFDMVKSLVERTPPATLLGDQAARQYFERCLSFLTHIVQWPFNQSNVTILGFQLAGRANTAVTPGPEWRDVFVEKQDLFQLLLHLYTFVRKEGRMAHMVQQGLTTMFSLYGDVFANERQRIQYAHVALQALLRLLSLGVSDVSEIWTMANMVNKFVTNFPVDLLIQLGHEAFQQLIAAVAAFTGQCISALQPSSYDSSCMEALDMLLDAWGLLVVATQHGATFIAEHAFKVFAMYVEARLALARQELREDDDEEYAEQQKKDHIAYADQLFAVSQLGRTTPVESSSLLLSALRMCFEKYQQALATGQQASVLEVVLEELHWLILMIGFFLCDAPEGEQVMAPPVLLRPFDMRQPDTEPVTALVNQVLAVAEFENSLISSRKNHLCSPLVAETICWFLARWIHSYLLLEESQFIRPSLMEAYGRNSPTVLQLVDFIIKKCALNLTMWAGESDVARETCNVLMALASRQITTSSIMSLQSWRDFLTAWTSGSQSLHELPAPIQGNVVQALARMTLGHTEEEQAQYIRAVIRPIEEKLLSYLNRHDFIPISHQSKVIADIFIILECFLGLVKATTMRSFRYIYAVVFPYMSAFVEMLKLYKDHSAVVMLILDIFYDFALYQLDWLPEVESSSFLDVCTALFTAYESSGLTRKGVQARSQVQTWEVEQSKAVSTLLYLLRAVADHDHPKSAMVTFHGLAILLPMLSQELLDFPKVRQTYFQVVSNVFRRHVQQVPYLTDEIFGALMSSFEYGLNHPEVVIQREALDAVTDIATFNFNGLVKGEQPLQPTKRKMLAQFVQVLLSFFLLGNHFSVDLIEVSSDAFLAIICSEKETYMSMVQALLQQQDPTTQAKLGQAFNTLMANVELSLDVKNKNRFREKMRAFLSTARSILQRK